MMKKLLSVLLALCMIFSMFIFPANAVEEGTNEEVAKVTFTYADRTTSEVDANKDEPIEYPALVAENRNNMYDAVWSRSADEYIPVPEESDGNALTVYEFRRYDKQSYESYNPEYDLVNKFPTNATITDERACEGSKSMKYDNRNLELFEKHWLYGGDIGTYWPQEWMNCYSYDEKTDVFTKLGDVNETKPDFEEGKYYTQRPSNQDDQGMFMVKGLGDSKNEGYTYSYKITFKYYVPEDMKYDVNIATKQISTSNFWADGIRDLNSTFVIPKTATNDWQTGELYVSANGLTAGSGGQAIAFKVDTAVTTGANERNCVVYFDDITTTEQVTCNYKNGTTSKVDANKGAAIEYPTLVAEDVNNMYDAVWSLSADEYVPVPEVSDGKALTVYEFRRTDKQSFESYNQNYELVNNKLPANATITDELAYEGSKSMKYDNRNLQLFENHWLYGGDIGTYWPQEWKNCYSYDAETDVITKLGDVTDTKPDFENGKYYTTRNSSEPDQGMFMVKGLGPYATYTYSYKITFKYYVPEDMAYDVKISTKQITTGNIWADGIRDLNSTFVIPKEATNGWKTGKLYVSANELVASTYGGQVIVFKVDTATPTGANARNCVVYFDDVVCKDYTPTPTVIYHHNDGVTEDTVVTEGIVAGNNNIAYVPTTAPAGKYFMGWYTDEALTTSAGTTFTVPSSGIQETDLYAKWGNYADYTEGKNYTLSAATKNGFALLNGETYLLDYNFTEGLGWTSNSTGEVGSVKIGKDSTGAILKWNPDKTDGIDQTTSTSQMIADEKAGVVGEVSQVGNFMTGNYTLRDENGKVMMAKPNTKYAAVLNYEVIGHGTLDVMLTAGRKFEKMDAVAEWYPYDNFHQYKSDNTMSLMSGDYNTSVANTPKGENHTYTFVITTGEFTNSIPAFSLFYSVSGAMGRRLKDDGNGNESYIAGGKTYYPYEYVDHPEIRVSSITLIEIGTGEGAYTYTSYEEGVGFDTEIAVGETGTSAYKATNNPDNHWYNSKEVVDIASMVYGDGNVNSVYNADYMMATRNVVDFEAAFFGNKFEKKFTKKDGQDVPAIYFNSVGYDEFMEGKDPAVDANINDQVIPNPDDDTKLFHVKDHYSKSTQMFRMGKAEDGHTYKVSFSIKADKFEADMGVHFASGIANNIWATPTYLADYYDITTSKVVAGENWYDFTYYVTYDAAGYYESVPGAGMDDTKESVREYFYIWFSQNITTHNLEGCDNEIYITDIVYEDLGVAVGKNGASVLNEEAMQTATSQAMRFYFTYETEDGSTIKIGDEIFTVKERGFIYKNGAIGKYTADNGAYTGLLLSTAGIKKSAKTEGFENCWAYEDGTMTFSTYVKGFTQELYDNKLIVRGYVTFADASGKLHTVYSDTVNRSVNGISDYHAAK
ncbi:MAG: hypothetical protein U0L72_08330 [Acutalibacteraceae bacterium]|nr:hypothetical protein [Acutalibacteraceae bacterium]